MNAIAWLVGLATVAVWWRKLDDWRDRKGWTRVKR